jgi:hypothetical protein
MAALKEHWLNRVMNTVVEINLFRNGKIARPGVRSGEIRPPTMDYLIPRFNGESSIEVTQSHQIIKRIMSFKDRRLEIWITNDGPSW